MTFNIEIDHFVIAAATLEQGINYIQKKLDVRIPDGGEHPKMGTHNCLMNVGDTFVEVIAINPDAKATREPRWFNLDSPSMQASLHKEPRLITWVARTSDIDEAVKRLNAPDMTIETVSRGDLTWRITVAKDGSLPLNGMQPTLIQWPDNVKPWENMKNLGFSFKKLSIETPDTASLTTILKKAGIADNKIEIAEKSEGHLSLSLRKDDDSIITI